ncbi:MAG: hypothetical protein H6718_10455 [Polyangiaceae bacterium]|nr:hypothetical protein [Myxococcales bacterium]MCB9585813.1 hypothetical protein [Polyangiaceae bacterium]MCB9607258.1 hypothetical protein [Polyangiaceae bacterium]
MIECSYCRAHIVTETQSLTQAPSTAVGTKPEDQPLALIFAISALVVLSGIGLAIFTITSGAGGHVAAQEIEVADLHAIQLEQSRDQFVAKHGGANRGRCVSMKVEKPSWFVTFCWNPAESDHVTNLTTNPSAADSELPPEVLKRARAVFGDRLTKDAMGWSYWGRGVSFLIHDSSLTLSLNIGSESEARLDEFWPVLLHVAFGEPLKDGQSFEP